MAHEPGLSLTSVLNRLLSHLVTSRRSIMAEWQADRDFLLKDIENIEKSRDNTVMALACLREEHYKSRHQLKMYEECFVNLAKERDLLLEDLERVTKERDEARKECCTWQGLESGRSKQHVAVARGWNYLTFPDQAALDALAKLDEEMGLL